MKQNEFLIKNIWVWPFDYKFPSNNVKTLNFKFAFPNNHFFLIYLYSHFYDQDIINIILIFFISKIQS